MYLLDTKKEEIELFTKNYRQIIKELAPSQNEDLTRPQFITLLKTLNLYKSDLDSDKMFWMFDSQNRAVVDAKELALSFEILKSNTLQEKLDTFFVLCDEDESGTIDRKEFYNLLKFNIVDPHD